MNIKAHIQNSRNRHEVTVSTNDATQSMIIPSKSTGFGSAVNGGELLLLALATCYCNDVYREAQKKGIKVESVEVKIEGEFGAEGEPASNILYSAVVTANADQDTINELMNRTDLIAEIQNTLRKGINVKLTEIKAVSS